MRVLGVFIKIALMLFVLPTSSAFSWSLETHLYIASRVLDDVLVDGKLSLCAGVTTGVNEKGVDCSNRYPVPASVVAAIRENPGSYLSGALGPDVFPDFIAAQVTVHPGLKGGWKTDDWLRFIRKSAASPAETAWASGYLSHAASDIFAHTWVNSYAGGIFDLGLHQAQGNEIELRHFSLERYIADRTPPAWQAYPSYRATPHKFVADATILNDSAANQYKLAQIPSHLVAIRSVHRAVGDVRDQAVRIKSKIFEIGLKELAPLRALELQLRAAEIVLKATQDAVKLGESALAERDRLIEQAERELLRLAKIIDDNPGLILGYEAQITIIKGSISGLEGAVTVAQSTVNAAQHALNQAQNILNGIKKEVTEEVCNWIDPFNWFCKDVVKITDEWSGQSQVVQAAKATLEAHQRVLNEALTAVAQAKSTIQNLEQAVRDAEKAISDAKLLQTAVSAQLAIHREQRKTELAVLTNARIALERAEKEILQLRSKLAELEKSLAPVTDLLARYDPFVLFLEKWVEDIRAASAALSDASEQIAHSIITKSQGSKLAPYQDWFQCWTPVLVAIPAEIPQTICTTKAEYLALKDKLEKELNDFVDRLGSLGWLIAPNVKLQQEFDRKVRRPLEVEVRKVLVRARGEIVTFLANRQLAELIDLMDSAAPMTDEKINAIYGSDDSGQRLLTLPDVASRIKIDAGLSAAPSAVSEDRFNALYNAIVLSKLSLLDRDGLNAVHGDLVTTGSTVYGPSLYGDIKEASFSILFGAVQSIDGNQQWQAVALPYPRDGGRDPGWPSERRYGRPGGPGDSGFRPWGDRSSRSLMFNRLFRGPMSPGLDAHPYMTAEYPFPACSDNPFPSTTDAYGALISSDLSCRLLAESASSGLPGRFSVLSVRRVRRQELRGLSDWDLRVSRNEIFARYGFVFGPDELVKYFSAQPWYRPSNESPLSIARKLTATEWHNIYILGLIER